MSLLKRLFGGGGATQEAPSETHNGYTITPIPIADGAQFRLSARVEREVDGTLKTHTLIRADTVGDLETAQTASVEKARQAIDSLGDGIFR